MQRCIWTVHWCDITPHSYETLNWMGSLWSIMFFDLVSCFVSSVVIVFFSLSSAKHFVAFCFPVGSFWEHGRKDGRVYRTGERWVEGREEELWARPRRRQIFSSLLEAGLWWWSSTREWIIEVCCRLRYFSSLYPVSFRWYLLLQYIFFPFFFFPLGLHCSLQKCLPRGSWIRVWASVSRCVSCI